MGIKESSQCEECHEIEFLDHMLFSCFKLQPFWQQINYKLCAILGNDLELKPEQALFGLTKNDIDASNSKLNEANHLILIAKLCIVKHRFKKPSNLTFIFEFEFLLRKRHFTSLISANNS